jgi:stage III sporulation protein AG
MALYLATLALLGVAMMLLGGLLASPDREEPEAIHAFIRYDDFVPPPVFAEAEPREKFLYERALEERLAEFLSLVEGAGQVSVMVSPLTGRETVFATDRTENTTVTNEADSEGGTRETRQSQLSQETVMVGNRTGTIEPLIIREIEPRVAGVVIVAEGGDCVFVRDALSRAARAVLGLDAHLIQVLSKQAP